MSTMMRTSLPKRARNWMRSTDAGPLRLCATASIPGRVGLPRNRTLRVSRDGSLPHNTASRAENGSEDALQAKIQALREEAKVARAREDEQRREVAAIQREASELRKKLDDSQKREQELESALDSREHGSGQLKTVIHSMRDALKALSVILD